MKARLVFSVFLFSALGALAQEDLKVVKLGAVPAIARKAIQTQAGANTIEEIERVELKGVVTYDVDTTLKDGTLRDFTIAANGTVVSQEIALTDAPVIVQKVIKAQIGTNTLTAVEKAYEDDGIKYEVTFTTPKNEDRNCTIDEMGKLESLEIALGDAPPVVQAAAKKQLGAGVLDEIDRVTDSDGTTYQINFTTKAGDERSFTLNDWGTLESLEITLADTPKVVQQSIKAEVGAGEVQDVDKIFEDGNITYEVGMTTKGGRYRNFTIAEDGKLDSREVNLAETPVLVQATIKEQLGTGKILRIDRSFLEKDTGVFPYEVQAEKNGKPFDFSVGPKGKFLGMDD